MENLKSIIQLFLLFFAIGSVSIPFVVQGSLSTPSTVFAPQLVVPKPNATEVALSTEIIISWNVLPSIQQLSLNPDVPIAEVANTSDPATSTFTLAKPLEPSTTYNVTIIYGNLFFGGVSSESWIFTTTNPVAPTAQPQTPKPSLIPAPTL
jgi:hypothetical protein